MCAIPKSVLPSRRDSFRIFQKLSEIFSDENNYSLSRELLIKVQPGQRTEVLVRVSLKNSRPVLSGLWGGWYLFGLWLVGDSLGNRRPW